MSRLREQLGSHTSQGRLAAPKYDRVLQNGNRMRVSKIRVIGASMGAAIAVGVPLAAAGNATPEPTAGTVDERVAQLEKDVQSLDARVDRLETPTPTSSTSTPQTSNTSTPATPTASTSTSPDGPVTLPATGTPPDPGARLVRSPNPSPVVGPAKLTGPKLTIRCADNPETVLNGRTLTAGTVVSFTRGCTWPNVRVTIKSTGTTAQPVLVNSVGTGAAPVLGSATKTGRFKDDGVLTVQGSNVHVTGLAFTGTPQGVGVRAEGNGNVLDQIEASRVPIGAWLKGNNNKVWNSYVHDLTLMGGTPGADDDYGATGFVIEGDDTRLEGNTARNAKAPSSDYPPYDGSFADIWRTGNRTILKHNYLDDAPHFLEAGGDGTGTANGVQMTGNVAKTRLDPWWFNTTGQYSIKVGGFTQVNNLLTRIR